MPILAKNSGQVIYPSINYLSTQNYNELQNGEVITISDFRLPSSDKKIYKLDEKSISCKNPNRFSGYAIQKIIDKYPDDCFWHFSYEPSGRKIKSSKVVILFGNFSEIDSFKENFLIDTKGSTSKEELIEKIRDALKDENIGINIIGDRQFINVYRIREKSL